MMAINLRPTPYYPQVFERKFKITADIFYGWCKDSEWQTKVRRGQAEWTVVPSNLVLLKKGLFINSYVQGEKEWAVPTKQEWSLDSSSSEMDFKAGMGQAEVLASSKKCCCSPEKPDKVMSSKINYSCIFGRAKATTLNKILTFLKNIVLLFSPLLPHPASTGRDWRTLLHIPPTHY